MPSPRGDWGRRDLRPYHRGVRRPHVTPTRYRRLALAALAAQVLIIVTGAAVRLTGSGLGCSDWPKCEQDRFLAPMEGHALIENGNRALSAVVLAAVLATILGALWRVPYRRDLLAWAAGPLLGVIAQILIGAVVVRLELAPISVVGHFLVSIVLVWATTVLVERAGHDGTPGVATVARPVVALGRVMVLAALVVITTGTLVTATGPHGGDEVADRLGWFDIGEIARSHGLAGLTLLALTLAALWLTRGHASPAVRRRGLVLALVLVAQLTVGYVQYLTGVPPLLVALHVLGSVLVWIAVLRFHLGLFHHPAAHQGPVDRPTTDQAPAHKPAAPA
jgi:cytochrome c oxidase assembly protein subunit 15